MSSSLNCSALCRGYRGSSSHEKPGIHHPRIVQYSRVSTARVRTHAAYSENSCTHSCDGYPCGLRKMSGSHVRQILSRTRVSGDIASSWNWPWTTSTPRDPSYLACSM